MQTRPHEDEYHEFYASYVARVPEGDLITYMTDQAKKADSMLSVVAPEHENYRYAEGKWSLKEVIRHILDTEWIFLYRALSIARGDKGPFPGIDQDDYMAGLSVEHVSLADLASEMKSLREALLTMISGLRDSDWNRRGIASECEVSVRALLFIIAGHQQHHLDVLRKKYL